MLKVSAVLVISLALFACGSNYQPVPEHFKIEAESSIAVTAGIAQTFIRSKASNYLLCTQSMPDAAYDQGDDADISYSLVDASSDQISGQDDSNEVEMAGRTPALLIAREMFYRACEFSGNYNLNKQEALSLYQTTLKTIGNVWATEAQNTTITIGDSVKDTSIVNVSDKALQTVDSSTSSGPLNGKSSQTDDSNSDDSDDDDDDYSSNN
jgi:hypothetical protein